MTDEELIAEGRKYAKRLTGYQLRLGQLALEYAPMGPHGGPHDDQGRFSGTTRTTEYAEAIGMEAPTLLSYRSVAHAWRGVDYGDLSYGILRALMTVEAKKTLVNMLEHHQPTTKTGRWTIREAASLARRHGLWEPTFRERAPGGGDVLFRNFTALAESVATLAERAQARDYTDAERELLTATLADVEDNIRRLRAILSGDLTPA